MAGAQFKQNHCEIVKPTMQLCTQPKQWGIVSGAYV